MSNETMKCVFEALLSRKETEDRDAQLRMVKDQLKVLADRLADSKPPEYTGWFALFAIDDSEPSGARFLRMFDPGTCEEDDEPEWSFCLPIPNPDSVKEFRGW